jgi:hypothetical protein
VKPLSAGLSRPDGFSGDRAKSFPGIREEPWRELPASPVREGSSVPFDGRYEPSVPPLLLGDERCTFASLQQLEEGPRLIRTLRTYKSPNHSLVCANRIQRAFWPHKLTVDENRYTSCPVLVFREIVPLSNPEGSTRKSAKFERGILAGEVSLGTIRESQ